MCFEYFYFTFVITYCLKSTPYIWLQKVQTQRETNQPNPDEAPEQCAAQLTEGEPGQESPSAKTATLLCDASTVMAIQLTEAELRNINELKVSQNGTFHYL